MKSVFLLGHDGMLGQAMASLLAGSDTNLIAPAETALDLNHPERVARAIPGDTELIINCAAFTDVDAAEAREAEATRINGDAVAALGRCARELDALLVHFSTDYVFSGRASEPYEVDAARAPLNAYGRSKLVGEEALEASGARYLLVRTSWLYAAWGKNFVRTMLGLMQHRPSVRVVTDQVGRPTSVDSLARRTLELVGRGASGSYHVTDQGQCSWYDFACAIAREAHLACVVEPCSSREFVRPAQRPAYSVLSLRKTEAELGPLRHWREPLAETVRTLLTNTALVFLMFTVLLSGSACSGSSEPSEVPDTSGVPPDELLVDLSQGDIGTLCDWLKARAAPVECADGSEASHAAKDPTACREAWPSEGCDANVMDLETCFVSDPCDEEKLAEVCGVLVSCSFDSAGDVFSCDDGIQRVAVSAVCDSIPDCSDASDEADCGEL